MSSFDQELVTLIIQFLKEEKLMDTVHKLEEESGIFFDMKYFEEKVLDGKWEEAEKYLLGFTKIHENAFSLKMFFEIRKQKYLEALDRNEKGEAVEILMKDLSEFANYSKDLYNNMTYLLSLENFRENEMLSSYTDTESARNLLVLELKRLIEANPLIRDKLKFPSIEASRLETLINQSKMVSDGNDLVSHMKNANSSIAAAQSSFAETFIIPSRSRQVSIPSMHSRIPSVLRLMETHNNDEEQKMIWVPSTKSDDMLSGPPPQTSLPLVVFGTVYMKSTPTSMDFHPYLNSLLAVGCANGGVALWEAGLREKLIFNPFKIWNISACSELFQDAIAKDPSMSVNRLLWSPKGDFVGVAFRKHLIQLYGYKAPKNIEQYLEIDAHVGSVNDLAFSYTKKNLCIVTCGDDKLIKVWDLNGQKLFNFEGHEAAVYSICPHQKEHVQFIISNDVDGKIMIWLHGEMAPMMEYDAPGRGCGKLLYSTDGRRLFSCGTNKDGESFLVEWDESEGGIKTRYSGLIQKSVGVVQCDIAENRILAVGEDNQIKFWDMNNINVLTTTYADGGLPNVPNLKFNKKGNLLVVTTQNNGLRILGNRDGFIYLSALKTQASDSASKAPVVSESGVRMMKRKASFDDVEKAREVIEKVDLVQCRSLGMPEWNITPTNKVVYLLYTNYGDGLLALSLKGVHKFWKWSRSNTNPSGKATSIDVPIQRQPFSGVLMTNEVPINLEIVAPCVTISRNDFYVMSTSGGKFSLFNMLTLKQITISVLPSLASTFLAFHPQDNNIVVVGTRDSQIHIYYYKEEKVKHILKGHQKYITGLAFSCKLNILVSSGADAQLFFWSMDSWEKMGLLSIQMAARDAPVGDTRVQFHANQVSLLVCNATQLAIYDVSKMELISQWMPQEGLYGSISFATFSCNGQLVYASLTDGNIGIFESDNLKLRYRIASSAYLHQISSRSKNVYAVVVAAHPHKPNQIAIGLSDGSVKVIEPIVPEGSWGIKAPIGTVSYASTANK